MTNFDTTMAALKQRFVARAADDLQTLRAHGDGQPLAPENLRATVHRLAGAAGLFGFGEISALAGAIDLRLAQAQDPGPLPELVVLLERLTAEPRP